MNIESIELVNVFFYSCTETFLYNDQDRDLVVLFHSMIQHELRFFFRILVFCSCNHCAHRAKIIHREEPVDRYKPSGTISFACSTHERQTTASWLLVFFFVRLLWMVIMIILNRLTEHILKYKTRSHIYMVVHVIRCAYLIFFLHTLLTCVGSFVFQRANWFMWPVIRSTFV